MTAGGGGAQSLGLGSFFGGHEDAIAWWSKAYFA